MTADMLPPTYFVFTVLTVIALGAVLTGITAVLRIRRHPMARGYAWAGAGVVLGALCLIVGVGSLLLVWVDECTL